MADIEAQRRATVVVDDQSVTCRRPDGLVESIRWPDLRAVLIHTTDQGPLIDDVFWVLTDGESGCVVPSESEGIKCMIERLQRLPNFDFDQAIQAMSSTDDRLFLCWQRQESGTS